jgi:phage-related protein
VKKNVFFDKRAEKEFKRFPRAVQRDANFSIDVLAREGGLIEPFGKKIDDKLFEIRIRYQGHWRLLYAYIIRNEIVILSAFQKKTQRTPVNEIKKAKERLRFYKT